VKSSVEKIFQQDGKSLIVAMDHARDWGGLPGLEQPGETIAKVLAGGADGIMTTYGVAKQFNHLTAGKATMIVRLDGWASCYCESWLQYSGWQQLYTVQDALRVGADAVIVNYFMGGPAEHDSLRVLANAAAEADHLGVPLVAECLPCPGPEIPDPNNEEFIAVAARIANEHGADVIKCYYSGSAEGFRRVTSTNPAPVMIAGGPIADSARDLLAMVHGAMEAGARGVFFGKNIWQSANPAATTRAIRRVIHEHASPDEAVKELA
jgi:class I fructose-bisphosphate aldolase